MHHHACPLNIVIGRMNLNTYDSEKINFDTANGVTSTTLMVDLNFDTCNEPAKAHVFDDTICSVVETMHGAWLLIRLAKWT